MFRFAVMVLMLNKSFSSRCPDERNCTDFEMLHVRYDLVLGLHNKIRSYVASGSLKLAPESYKATSASNMQLMGWNTTLAEMAEEWIRCCIQRNDSNQYDESLKNENIGQNVITVSGLGEETALVLHWFKQIERVNNIIYSNDTAKRIGDFTQMIWANTFEVGCAMGKYNSSDTNQLVTRMVCNYYPMGNIVGENIFEIGAPCSSCPGLCDMELETLCLLDLLIASDEREPGVTHIRDNIYAIKNKGFYMLGRGIWKGRNCRCDFHFSEEVDDLLITTEKSQIIKSSVLLIIIVLFCNSIILK